MCIRDSAFTDQQGGLQRTGLITHPAIERVHTALRTGTPEQNIERHIKMCIRDRFRSHWIAVWFILWSVVINLTIGFGIYDKLAPVISLMK